MAHENGKEIVERIKNGDLLAFQDLYTLYYHDLCSFALMYIDSHEEVEDVIQEIFVKLWKRRFDLQITHLKNYLLSAVKNACLNVLQHKEVVKKHSEVIQQQILLNELETIDLYENEKEFELSMEHIRACISELPEKTREVIELKYVQGLGAQEISERTGTSKRTVETQLYKGLKMLSSKVLGKILIFIFFVSFIVRNFLALDV